MYERSVSFLDAIRLGFSKYFDFSGRAQRAEYWWFMLFVVLGSMLTGVLDAVLFGWGSDDVTPVSLLFSLGTLVPSFSVAWRRLHDIGKSGLWNLLPLVTLLWMVISLATVGIVGETGSLGLVGGVGVLLFVASAAYVLFLTIRDSDPEPNRYGPSPKYDEDALAFG